MPTHPRPTAPHNRRSCESRACPCEGRGTLTPAHIGVGAPLVGARTSPIHRARGEPAEPPLLLPPLLVIPRSKATRNLRSQPRHNARRPHSPPRATSPFHLAPPTPYPTSMPTYPRPTAPDDRRSCGSRNLDAPRSSSFRLRPESRGVPCCPQRGHGGRRPPEKNLRGRAGGPNQRRKTGTSSPVEGLGCTHLHKPWVQPSPYLRFVLHPPFSAHFPICDPLRFRSAYPSRGVRSYLRPAVPIRDEKTTPSCTTPSDGGSIRPIQAVPIFVRIERQSWTASLQAQRSRKKRAKRYESNRTRRPTLSRKGSWKPRRLLDSAAHTPLQSPRFRLTPRFSCPWTPALAVDVWL